MVALVAGTNAAAVVKKPLQGAGQGRPPVAIGVACPDFEGKGAGFAKKPAPESECFPRLPLLAGTFSDSYPNQEPKRPFSMSEPHPLYPHLKRIDCEYK